MKPLSPGKLFIVWIALTLFSAGTADAHLLVENALDIVAGPDHITATARIASQEILTIEAKSPDLVSEAELHNLANKHRAYVLSHLHITADGTPMTASAAPTTQPDVQLDSGMAVYTIEYPLTNPPKKLTLLQDFLQEIQPSDASFVVRFRQANETEFEVSQLPRNSKLECDLTLPPQQSIWKIICAFISQGIWHILTGYDHLLFVTGLLLGARSLLDLVKVVFAFTLAHSLTLALSVFNIVNIRSQIVEPMISASIVAIALQNIFWPRKSSGWPRVATAFAFGLFHGLGFAGGLKDAMADLPPVALWTALVSFSAGVEIGHQVVVLPMFAIVALARRKSSHLRASAIDRLLVRWGSAAIACAGTVYLIIALRQSNWSGHG